MQATQAEGTFLTDTRTRSGPPDGFSVEASSTSRTEPAAGVSHVGAAGPIGLLEGTELIGEFKSSGYREASHLVGRSDGQLVRLAPVLYAVVTAFARHGRVGGTEILSRVGADASDETGLELTAGHIAYLMDRKLAPLGITTASNGVRPTIATKQPFLSLRFKKAVLPSSATWFLGGLFSGLFQRASILPAVTAVLLGEIWLFATQPMGSALAQALANPTSLLLVAGLAIASAFFHEIGHATACRYGGVRPGAIGSGVYIAWPVFYTDITNSYRLDRAGRLRAVLGGVYFNALFLLGLMVVYAWTEFPALLAAILVVNLELLQQLLPTLRFDGYYIAADLVGVPDLFKYIGPILKRTLLRQPADERLGALKIWPQRVVTLWVLVVLPALIAQLAFVGFQMPKFVAIGWDRIATIGRNLAGATSGGDLFGLVADVALTAFAVLPLAGLLVLVLQAGRGVTNVVRKLQTDGDEPADVNTPTAGPQDVPASKRSPFIVKALLVFTAVLLLINVAYLLSSRDSDATRSARVSPLDGTSRARGTPGIPPSLPGQTTTTVALPAGHDEIVESVIDGDSFQVRGGFRIRLVGIDAPDVETGGCFAAEAKAHLTHVLTPGSSVRVVDEVNRSDEFGRTLASVYRLPDGLFVNLALARDGFAYAAATRPSDEAYAAELPAAVREAADARRGLWSSCPRPSPTGRGPVVPGIPREPSNSAIETPPPTTPPNAAPATTLPPVFDFLDKLLKGLLGPRG